MNNTLDQALAALHLPPDAGDPWRGAWAASEAGFAPGRLAFLTPEFLAETCGWLGMSAGVREALSKGLALFTRAPSLSRLAWHCHRLLAAMPGGADHPARWPKIPRDLGEPATLFYAYVLLSAVPALVKQNRARGIPDSVTTDTLGDIDLWIREYRSRHGLFGLDEFGWLANHLSGRLHKLGRLQFNFEFWDFDFHAFRHRRTRRVTLLAGAGHAFRADGQFHNADGGGAAPAWTSVFHEPRPAVIRGHPLAPSGRVLPDPIELALADWELVFRRGDPALGVHIPATGPMGPAECGEAFRRAMSFFPRHFPDRPWRAFTCDSWLLDPQFEGRLPDSANIPRFLREWFLFPIPGASPAQHYERVFGWQFTELAPADIGRAPQATSLQRVLAAHVAAGGRWRKGGGVIFPEDLDWGAQVYRRPDGAAWEPDRPPQPGVTPA